MGPVRAVPVRTVPVLAVPVRAVRMWNPVHAGSGSTFRGSRRSGSVRGFPAKRFEHGAASHEATTERN